jgi:hypothetical protein
LTIRRTILFILYPLFLGAPNLSAQLVPLRICTVQPSEGFGSGPPGTAPGWGGFEAKKLANELATRKLADGTPIQAVAIVRKTREDSEAEARRQECPYVVELWYHISVDDIDTNSPAFTPSPPQRGNLAGDSTEIEYAMSRNDTRKVIARGSAPPAAIHKSGWRDASPYLIFANQIVAKLNLSRPR